MKKLLYAVFILLIFGCSCSQNSNDIPQSDNFSLQILHFNDIHSSESFNIEITAADTNTAASAGGCLDLYRQYLLLKLLHIKK